MTEVPGSNSSRHVHLVRLCPSCPSRRSSRRGTCVHRKRFSDKVQIHDHVVAQRRTNDSRRCPTNSQSRLCNSPGSVTCPGPHSTYTSARQPHRGCLGPPSPARVPSSGGGEGAHHTWPRMRPVARGAARRAPHEADSGRLRFLIHRDEYGESLRHLSERSGERAVEAPRENPRERSVVPQLLGRRELEAVPHLLTHLLVIGNDGA